VIFGLRLMAYGLWFPAYGFRLMVSGLFLMIYFRRFIFDDLFGNLINGVAADA